MGFRAIKPRQGCWRRWKAWPFRPQKTDVEPSPPPGGEWDTTTGLAAPEMRPLLADLSQRGTPAPEAGFELVGDRGAVVAVAEFAWPAHGIATFLPEQEAHASAFVAAGVQAR